VDNLPGVAAARWSVRPAETVAAAVAGAALLGFALFADAPGRILGAIAGLGLIALAAADLVWRPRLAVDGAGLSVRTPGRRVRLAWDQVDAVRVDQQRRFGLISRTLEIDAGDDLVVLGRRSVGTDPRAVAVTLRAYRR
jgi:hypothetical protein